MQKKKFIIYRRDARKGSSAYSPKPHSAPHFEYEAELDEAWNEGSHNGGGTICVDIPPEWFGLSYDVFLERVITLAAATHYGFTVDDLKEKKGLKEFFGFNSYD